MFSTTFKRSVATLGVVAGLLAAAGPASAQILDGPVLATAGPQLEAGGYLASDPSSEVDNQIIDGNNLDRVFQIRGDAQDTQTSRASRLKDTLVSGYNVKAAAPGTQVGSEGVKAPTGTAEEFELGDELFEFAKAPTGADAPIDSGPGDDNVKGPSKADNQFKYELAEEVSEE